MKIENAPVCHWLQYYWDLVTATWEQCSRLGEDSQTGSCKVQVAILSECNT